jgi:acetyl-CoA carboxylase carboxyltransferase component
MPPTTAAYSATEEPNPPKAGYGKPQSRGRAIIAVGSMTWEPELEEIRRRRERAKEMGGAERVARHIAAGWTPLRDRTDQLLDAGSFREIGSLASRVENDEKGRIKAYTPSNFITGRGTIKGRPVIIGCDDFTVRAGAADGAVTPTSLRLAGTPTMPPCPAVLHARNRPPRSPVPPASGTKSAPALGRG